jgi:hypothetical protein
VKPAEDDQGKGDADHVAVPKLLSVYLAFAFPVTGDQQSDAPDVRGPKTGFTALIDRIKPFCDSMRAIWPLTPFGVFEVQPR